MMRLKKNEKAARRLGWCKATTLIAVVAPLALLALSTPLQADTEEEFQQTLGDETGGIEGLAYDYVFGKVSKEQFEDALIDAGGDIIVGLFDLGGAAVGVPGVGTAFKSVFNLFADGAGADPTAERLKLIEQRLDAVEGKVNSLSQTVNRIAIRVAQVENAQRTLLLHERILELRRLAQMRATLPEMGPLTRTQFLNDVIASADRLLPTENSSDDIIWNWTNIRFTTKNGKLSEPGFIVRRQTALALETYLYAVALIAAVRDEVGVSNPQQRSAIGRHIAFLTGDPDRMQVAGLEFSLVGELTPVDCGWGTSSAGATQCEVSFACRGSGVERREVKLVQTGASSSCRLVQQPSHEINEIFDRLTLQVRQVSTPTAELLRLAAERLDPSGEPPSGEFDTSTSVSAAHIYAVEKSGQMRHFVHTTISRDLWRAKAPPKVDANPCSGPGAAYSEACRAISAPKVDCSKPANQASEQCQAPLGGVTPDKGEAVVTEGAASPLSRYQVTNEVQQGSAVSGNWSGFSEIVAGGVNYLGTVVYGLRPDGAVIWRRMGYDGGRSRISEAATPVRTGWNNYSMVFSTGEGVVYAVAPNGDLIWNKQENVFDRTAAPKWKSRIVGRGWNRFVRLFSPGKGVIYAVQPDGALYWYRHSAYLTGAGLESPTAWEKPAEIGSGWQSFEHLAAGPGGHIYAVTKEGSLLFYEHRGWRTGARDWAQPITLANDWSGYEHIFTPLLQPEDSVIVVN